MKAFLVVTCFAALQSIACGGGSDGPDAPEGDGGGDTELQPTLPSVPVQSCSGTGCPYGECGYYPDPACGDLYPGAAGPTSNLCSDGKDGTYCLSLESDVSREDTWGLWGVQCTGGQVVRLDHCPGGCGVASYSTEISCR